MKEQGKLLLELRNIRKSFPVKGGFFGLSADRVKAVDGIDLSVAKGENLSLVGESGCGKTTLARIVLRLTTPDEGSIKFDGSDITRAEGQNLKNARRHMQMVFQDPYSSLDPRYTVKRIMAEALTLDSKMCPGQNEKLSRMQQLLGSVNLGKDILNRYPHEFSGGERQRIAIARALMLNPKLLVLDEAVSSLDVIIQKQLIDLLARLREKFDLTYLFISHNLKVVRKISHRIAVMYRGKIVEVAQTEEIFNNPLHPYTKDLLMAAIDYKAVERETTLTIDGRAQLVDRGGGHLVLSGEGS